MNKKLLERIVEYSRSRTGLRLVRIEVGKSYMGLLAQELKEMTGVDLGALPPVIKFMGVTILFDDKIGTERVDALWEDTYLTQAGRPLAQ